MVSLIVCKPIPKSFEKMGKKIGKALTIEFTPVIARKVRLLITRASEGPTIKEFRLFPPGK